MKENHLESLIIPQQSFGEEGFKILCGMITEQPSFLKKLDISWNELFGNQIEKLFAALAENKDLEFLNIAMTSLHNDTDTKNLRRFIRRN